MRLATLALLASALACTKAQQAICPAPPTPPACPEFVCAEPTADKGPRTLPPFRGPETCRDLCRAAGMPFDRYEDDAHPAFAVSGVRYPASREIECRCQKELL